MAAVTAKPLWLTLLPAASFSRMTGCCRNETPARAQADGWVTKASWLAGTGRGGHDDELAGRSGREIDGARGDRRSPCLREAQGVTADQPADRKIRKARHAAAVRDCRRRSAQRAASRRDGHRY